GGIINDTVGLAQFLPVKVENATITGADGGYGVNAAKSYAGGFSGQGLGSSISNVTISNVKGITADNYAGGFLGSAGVGSLAASDGGLDLLGLGLVKINNLLSVAEWVGVNISQSSLTGIGSGFTVTVTGNTPKTHYY